MNTTVYVKCEACGEMLVFMRMEDNMLEIISWCCEMPRITLPVSNKKRLGVVSSD